LEDSEKQHFSKYEIVKTSGHTGSYFIKDENGKSIGFSEGYTIKRRSIILNLGEASHIYEIVKRENNHYIILKNDEIEAAFRIHTFYSQIGLRTENEVVIRFYPKNNYKTYNITQKKK